MVKNLEEEEKEKKSEEKEEEKEKSWFQTVPPIYKIAGLGLLFIQYQRIQQEGGNINQLFIWIAIVLFALYFLGTEVKKIEKKIISPEDAEDALRKEIKRRIKTGRIPRFTKWFITENDGLFHHEGMPQHYQIGLKFMMDYVPVYKKAVVMAEGETAGYVTIQTNPGEFQGTEPIPVMRPKWMEDAVKKYDMDWTDLIFGKRKKR